MKSNKDGFHLGITGRRGPPRQPQKEHSFATCAVRGQFPELEVWGSKHFPVSFKPASQFCCSVRPDAFRGLKLWSPSAIKPPATLAPATLASLACFPPPSVGA